MEGGEVSELKQQLERALATYQNLSPFLRNYLECVEALEQVMNLVELGDLVRNTHSDAEFMKFFEGGFRVVTALKAGEDVLASARKLVESDTESK